MDGEFDYEEGLFYGVISTSDQIVYTRKSVEFVERVLKNKGAFLYIYNGEKEKPNINKMSKLFEMDLNKKIKDGQIIFTDLTKVLEEHESVDYLNNRINYYIDTIDNLKSSGFEKIVILGTRDSNDLDRFTNKGLYNYHKRIKRLCKENNIMAVIRYVIGDLSKRELAKLISLHDLISLEGDNTGVRYTYLEMISTSLVYLSKQKEKDEEYKKEMERIEYLKSLGELIEGFTHDFNNLLTAIIGFSQIALLKDTENLVREYLNIIYETAIDGKAMVDKVHEYVRGNYNGEKKVHHINDLIKGSINMIAYKIKSTAKEAENKIVLTLDLKSEKSIYCDEFEIRQVFLNMLLNALAAMKEGGTLTVKTYDKEEKIYIEIIDSGIGMSEEIQKKIFEPFFTTKGKDGTGLGLNTSKKILENHSAEILVESQLGKGSKFTIVFPQDESKSKVVHKEIDPHSIYGAKVLVVDDMYSVGKSIAELIGMINMTAEVETRAEKVMKRLEEKTYDIIICDYTMPNMNGVELSKIVKEKYPERPFILMTGHQDKLLESWDTIDHVLGKPCTIEELADVLGQALNVIDDNKNKGYNII